MFLVVMVAKRVIRTLASQLFILECSSPEQAGRLTQTDGIPSPWPTYPSPTPTLYHHHLPRNEGASGQAWAGQGCFAQINCGRLRNEVARLAINKASSRAPCSVLRSRATDRSSRAFFLDVWPGLVCLSSPLHCPLPLDLACRLVLLGCYRLCSPGFMF